MQRYIGGTGFYFLLTLEKKQTKIIGLISAVVLAILIWGPFYGNATLYRFRTTFVGSKDESYKVRAKHGILYNLISEAIHWRRIRHPGNKVHAIIPVTHSLEFSAR